MSCIYDYEFESWYFDDLNEWETQQCFLDQQAEIEEDEEE